jgi:hypothetical protein
MLCYVVSAGAQNGIFSLDLPSLSVRVGVDDSVTPDAGALARGGNSGPDSWWVQQQQQQQQQQQHMCLRTWFWLPYHAQQLRLHAGEMRQHLIHAIIDRRSTYFAA